MPRSVAINVGANTQLPGFRGPVRPDGGFEYVPIPEREPTAEPVPTYGDLDLATDVPTDLLGRRVHLDPEFAGYPCCSAYTYGDEHGVKAGPLSALSAGDYVLFYATLSATRPGEVDWMSPDWGAYLIGRFRLARDPVTGAEYRDLPPAERARFASNAHVRRETFDARVLLAGDPDGSALYDVALPLSGREAGATPNRLVTGLSADSGKGPWWRRPLRFDEAATAELLVVREAGETDRCFAD